MSRFFIHRPIFAAVISIVIVIAGSISLVGLPVAKFPEVTPPTVRVSCFYPGANAQVVAETVAAPIEQEVNGVEGMLYMSSMSADDGSYALTVTFEIGTDMDMATVLVQNRVAIATPRLPEEVRRQGVTTKKQSTQIVQFITLYSPTGRFDALYLSNYATLELRDELARIDGVGDVTVFGVSDYAMRVWLDPRKLKARNLTTEDVVAAIREQNVQVAAGQIGAPPAPQGTAYQLTINTLGRLDDVDQFANLIVKTSEGRITRVKDVAEVQLGAKSYKYDASYNQQPCVALAIYQLPGANALDVAGQVTSKMKELGTAFPEGLEYKIPFDTTRFVIASIAEVYETLFIAVVLVVLVIFIFLQDWRATLIPCVAIPVSLVGTFAIMAGIGFSINMLTLFGIVLAIGIVVDDAIVVVENTSRHLDDGLAPTQAAVKAMSEITGPVIATTLVLLAVFVPTAFMGGITGQLYRQFALTISGAVVISTINALTLSPALCGILLRPSRQTKKGLPAPAIAGVCGLIVMLGAFSFTAPMVGMDFDQGRVAGSVVSIIALRAVLFAAGAIIGFTVAKPLNRILVGFFGGFDRVFDLTSKAYSGVIHSLVRKAALVGLVVLGLFAVTGYTFVSVPTGFLPIEDQGYVIANIQLPDAASLERTIQVNRQIDQIVKETPGVADWVSVSGYSILSGTAGSNQGMVFIILKPWAERTTRQESLRSVIIHLRRQLARLQAAEVVAFPPPAIDGLGISAGFQMQLRKKGNINLATLQQIAEGVVQTGNEQSGLTALNTTIRASVPQLYLDVDRTKVKTLDVSLSAVFDTLQAFLGSTYVNDFNLFSRTYQVLVQAGEDFRVERDDIRNLDVRNSRGEMVPIGTFVTIQDAFGAQAVMRYNLYESAQINGEPAPGTSSGDALLLMEQLCAATLPPAVDYQWTGMSFQEKQVGGEQFFIFALAVVFVFLVLAAQYESWTNPAAVIAVVPLAALGVVIALVVRGMDNNVYTQIGIVLLVALASKNAILIVEFARDQRAGGMSIVESAAMAARLRFRAILMTAFSSILGFMPLLIASGAGAASRQAVGTAVVGGMIAATFFSLLLVPSFFVIFQWLAELGRPVQPGRQADSNPA